MGWSVALWNSDCAQINAGAQLKEPGYSRKHFQGSANTDAEEEFSFSTVDTERSRDRMCTTPDFSPGGFPVQAGFENPFVGYSQKRLAGAVQSPVSERSRWEESAGAQEKQGLGKGNCVTSDTGGAPWGAGAEQQLLLYSVPRGFVPSVPSWSGKRTQFTLWLWIFFRSNPPFIGICFNLMKHNFCLKILQVSAITRVNFWKQLGLLHGRTWKS